MTTLLLVDDDHEYRAMLGLALEDEGFHVLDARNAEAALYEYGQHAVDLALLDVRLPGMDGVELCREIRRRGRTPVIAMTADDSATATVRALDAGADDYVTKPVQIPTLVARINAVLRRSHGPLSGVAKVQAGECVITVPEGELIRGGQPVELTARQRRLLAVLADRPNVVVSPQELAERVWEGDTALADAELEATVREVQQALEPGTEEPAVLVAVGTTGFRLVA